MQPLHPALQRWLILVLCSNLLACTTLQSLPLTAWQASAAAGHHASRSSAEAALKLKPGDKLVLATVQQAHLALQLTVLQDDALVGVNEVDNSVVHVPLADIVTLQRQQVDPIRTVLLVLAAVVLLVAVVNALAVSKLLNAGTAGGP